MMKIRLTVITLITFVFCNSVLADPPKPPFKYRWVLQYDFSDEFNGNALDKSKWRDYFDGWKGRAPAKFMPYTISVQDGTMQIKNDVLSPASGSYTIAGGAVQSLSDQAHYGYYECRAKASKIRMSTTFWMSNKKVLLDETTDCSTDKYSQELDITEVVGGHTGTKFETGMNSNTHYRHIPCGATKEVFHSEGMGSTLNSKVWEDFHTYACWWVDGHTAKFYADDVYTGEVQINTDIDATDPFDRPMKINMVTETYNWCTPYPTESQLKNDDINTSYYDWVRGWKLVAIDEEVTAPDSVIEVFAEEEVQVIGVTENWDAATSYNFNIVYKTNYNETLIVQLADNDNNIVASNTYNILSGYGRGEYNLSLDEIPVSGNYHFTVTLLNGQEYINSENYTVTIGNTNIENTTFKPNIEIIPNPAFDQISIHVLNPKMKYQIVNTQGVVIQKGKMNYGPIDISTLQKGMYILKLQNGETKSFVKTE